MRMIYVRPTRERSAKAQIDAWRCAGYWVDGDRAPLYVEAQPKRKDGKLQPTSLTARADAINALVLHPGQGDDIGVESLHILGLTEADILDAMQTIGEAGGTIYVLSEDRRISWHPDVIALVRAIREAGSALRRDQSAPGRRSAQVAGTAGAKPKLGDADRAKAARDWHDPAFTSQAAVARKWGVAIGTLYNYFGPRFLAVEPERKASR
jgi:hypothetical protein